MPQRIPKGASRSVGLTSPLTISGRALSTTTDVITGTSWIEER